MTVSELKAIIANLPDDMIVASYDVGGYLQWEFCGADVIDPKSPPNPSDLDYPQPDTTYLRITA